MAKRTPSTPPHKFASASGTAHVHTTWPCGIKKASAARLVVELMTLADAFAVDLFNH